MELSAEQALDATLAAACQYLAHLYGLRKMVEDKSPETPEEMMAVHTFLMASQLSSRALDEALDQLKATDRSDETLQVDQAVKIAGAIQVIIDECQRHSKVVNECAEREQTNAQFQEMMKAMQKEEEG